MRNDDSALVSARGLGVEYLENRWRW